MSSRVYGLNGTDATNAHSRAATAGNRRGWS